MTNPKGRADHFILGDYNAVCYECGRKRKASQLKVHWQGYKVCAEHWESRQPQDFVRGVPDVQQPAWTQPMPANVFAALCTPNGNTAYPGEAVPGCVKPSYISPFFSTAITDYL